MRILLDHVCPNCRAPREAWEVRGTKARADLKLGMGLPAEAAADLRDRDAVECRDKCADCGETMSGTLQLDHDEGTGTQRILSVDEGLRRPAP